MNNELPLRDIHLPDAVSWWPPAIGWWLLLLLTIVLVGIIFYTFRYLRRPRLDKSARLAMISTLTEYKQHQDVVQLISSLSRTFKRIVMSYYGREQTAHVTGDELYARINKLVLHDQLSPAQIELLSVGPYRRDTGDINADIDELVKQCRKWVDALPSHRNHVDDRV